jgi:hypothetical protein
MRTMRDKIIIPGDLENSFSSLEQLRAVKNFPQHWFPLGIIISKLR